jgi:hypothetical protein
MGHLPKYCPGAKAASTKVTRVKDIPREMLPVTTLVPRGMFAALDVDVDATLSPRKQPVTSTTVLPKKKEKSWAQMCMDEEEREDAW